jgi:hypothetical protein
VCSSQQRQQARKKSILPRRLRIACRFFEKRAIGKSKGISRGFPAKKEEIKNN